MSKKTYELRAARIKSILILAGMFLLVTFWISYLAIGEINDAKYRYCEVEPDSTFCKMYPNIGETT